MGRVGVFVEEYVDGEGEGEVGLEGDISWDYHYDVDMKFPHPILTCTAHPLCLESPISFFIPVTNSYHPRSPLHPLPHQAFPPPS